MSLFGYQFGVLSNASAFSPLSIDGLSFWLDASDTSSLDIDGIDVNQWNDKSGSGNHVWQTTADAKPHIGTTINGLNTVSFDGVDDFLFNDTVSGAFTGSTGDCFAVMHLLTPATSPAFFAIASCTGPSPSTTNSVSMCISDDGAGTRIFQICERGPLNPPYSLDIQKGSTNMSSGETRLCQWRSDGALYYMWVDGNAETIETALPLWAHGSNSGRWFSYVPNRNNLMVGGRYYNGSLYNPSPGNLRTGRICEVLYWDDKVLDPNERSQTETYLANKWGVSI